jgi:hypothetical protein
MMWTEGGGKGSGGGRASSVECDPSCRMAAAFLGARCECETLIVFFHLKTGVRTPSPAGIFGVRLWGPKLRYRSCL